MTCFIKSIVFQLFQIFAQRFSGNSHDIQVQHGFDFFHDGRNASGIVEELGRPFTGRTDIQQIMGSPVHAVEGVSVNFKAQFMGHCRNMQQGIGGTGYGGMYHNGVFKGLHGHDIAYLKSLFGKLHYL